MIVRAQVIIEYEHFGRVRKQFPKALKQVLLQQRFASIADVQEAIIERDLIDTGFMLNYVFGRSSGQYEEEVVSPAHYSGYLNYGTIFMDPEPFFEDAVDKARKEFPKRFAHLEQYLV